MTKRVWQSGWVGLGAGLLLAGCGPRETGDTGGGTPATSAPPSSVTPGSTSPPPANADTNRTGAVLPSGSELMREARQTAESATKYLQGTRDQAVAAIDQRLKAVDKDLASLRQRTAELRAEARQELETALTSLQDSRTRAGEVLEQAKTAATETWDVAKEKLAQAMSEVESAWTRAKEKVKHESGGSSPTESQ